MTLLARRLPPKYSVLFAAGLFTVLATYAIVTGDAFVPGGHGSKSEHILKAVRPGQYWFMLSWYLGGAVITCLLAFFRLVPVEDGWRRFKERSDSTIHAKGYDSKPAPKWAYAFLLGFLGLIVWIGWKTMYSE
jgi:hypothetical protein